MVCLVTVIEMSPASRTVLLTVKTARTSMVKPVKVLSKLKLGPPTWLQSKAMLA